MIPRKPIYFFVLVSVLLFETCIRQSAAFQPSIPSQNAHGFANGASQPLCMGKGFDSSSNQSDFAKGRAASTPAGDFAYQEMLVYFNQMQRDGVTSRTMDPAKRSELEGFVRTVLANKKGLRLEDIGQALLPKSEWKLMFSTSEAVLESLPNDATVFLNIQDEMNLDYVLRFSKKTMGLDSLTAKCQYTFDTGPVQPGLLTFVYDKITTNIFGLNNIGVGFFGLLKGRANYVESSYFDGVFWIERGISNTGNGDFINVYMRMDA